MRVVMGNSCNEKTYYAIADALIAFQDEINPFKRGCKTKIVDSLCVRNELRVSSDATSIIGDIETISVINNTLNTQTINATSIFVTQINGSPISPSSLDIVGSTGATDTQGAQGNTRTLGNPEGYLSRYNNTDYPLAETKTYWCCVFVCEHSQ